MKTMLREQREIDYELKHFKHIIDRIHKVIINNPCDNTLLIEREKERLRKELPPIIERHNLAKKKENAAKICPIAPIAEKADVKRTNIHEEIVQRE